MAMTLMLNSVLAAASFGAVITLIGWAIRTGARDRVCGFAPRIAAGGVTEHPHERRAA